MSSFVGTGVAETVVFIEAVATGPTNKFQRSSTSIVIAEVNAVGFATAVPFREAELAGVGIIVVGGDELEVFWAMASVAGSNKEFEENFILSA